jgi:hypothetical protein
LICNLQNRFEKEKRISELEIGFGPNFDAAQQASPHAHGLRGPAGRRCGPVDRGHETRVADPNLTR